MRRFVTFLVALMSLTRPARMDRFRRNALKSARKTKDTLGKDLGVPVVLQGRLGDLRGGQNPVQPLRDQTYHAIGDQTYPADMMDPSLPNERQPHRKFRWTNLFNGKLDVEYPSGGLYDDYDKAMANLVYRDYNLMKKVPEFKFTPDDVEALAFKVFKKVFPKIESLSGSIGEALQSKYKTSMTNLLAFANERLDRARELEEVRLGRAKKVNARELEEVKLDERKEIEGMELDIALPADEKVRTLYPKNQEVARAGEAIGKAIAKAEFARAGDGQWDEHAMFTAQFQRDAAENRHLVAQARMEGERRQEEAKQKWERWLWGRRVPEGSEYDGTDG